MEEISNIVVSDVAKYLGVGTQELGDALYYRGLLRGDYLLNDAWEDIKMIYDETVSLFFTPAPEEHVLVSHNCRPVVYFLFEGNELTYVGKSFDVFSRISEHNRSKVFDGMAVVQVDRKRIDIVELFFISKFKPRDNKVGTSVIEFVRKIIKTV